MASKKPAALPVTRVMTREEFQPLYDSHLEYNRAGAQGGTILMLRDVSLDFPMEGMDFRGAAFDGVKFYGHMSHCNFEGASILACQIGPQSMRMPALNFQRARLTGGTEFTSCKVDADFSNTSMNDVHFNEVSFVNGAGEGTGNFQGARLTTVKFRGCNLRHASFTQAGMGDSDFYQCHLSDASFTRVEISDVRLQACNAENSRWTDATLSNIAWGNTTMEGATLMRLGQDARGYEFYGIPDEEKVVHIKAGCRNFTGLEQARRHWHERHSNLINAQIEGMLHMAELMAPALQLLTDPPKPKKRYVVEMKLYEVDKAGNLTHNHASIMSDYAIEEKSVADRLFLEYAAGLNEDFMGREGSSLRYPDNG